MEPLCAFGRKACCQTSLKRPAPPFSDIAGFAMIAAASEPSDAYNSPNGKRKYMKRVADSVLLLLVAITCLITYGLYQQNNADIPQGGRQNSKPTIATGNVHVSDNRRDGVTEASQATLLETLQKNRAAVERPVDLASRSKAKHATQSSSRSPAEGETAAAPESAGGGGEVLLTPERGCAPDSYIVQPCSFEDWTYTFPQD